MFHRSAPEHIRSDNGPEFSAKAVREWLGRLDVGTLFIEPGSPWARYCSTFLASQSIENIPSSGSMKA